MALTEQEELELLELEEQEAMAYEQQTQSQQSPVQRQNILGRLENVPSAAIRSLIQGKGYAQGAMQPDTVPTFQSLASEKFNRNMPAPRNDWEIAAQTAGGTFSSLGGMAADVATNPLGMLGMLVGKAPGAEKAGKAIVSGAKNVGSTLKKLMTYDNALKRSATAKEGLDTLRTTIGQAKSLAVKEVENVPVQLKTLGEKLPQVAVDAIKKTEYAVEILKDGSLKPTIGNMDKVKEALGDLIGGKPPAWRDSTKAAKREIKNAYFLVRDSMVDAAKTVGKDLKKPLEEYHKFMVNYNKINPALIDKNGEIVANKLKIAFKWSAEPAYKNAWKEVAKASPEIKSVMNSMNKRELLKNILKITAVGTAVTGTGKYAIDSITK